MGKVEGVGRISTESLIFLLRVSSTQQSGVDNSYDCIHILRKGFHLHANGLIEMLCPNINPI